MVGKSWQRGGAELAAGLENPLQTGLVSLIFRTCPLCLSASKNSRLSWLIIHRHLATCPGNGAQTATGGAPWIGSSQIR